MSLFRVAAWATGGLFAVAFLFDLYDFYQHVYGLTRFMGRGGSWNWVETIRMLLWTLAKASLASLAYLLGKMQGLGENTPVGDTRSAQAAGVQEGTMSTCSACGKSVAEKAIVCKHCGARLGRPPRPVGVTVIAILVLIGVVSQLFAVIAARWETSFLFGRHVPPTVFRVVTAAMAALSLYCGIGLLRQRAVARRVTILYLVVGVVGSILNASVMSRMLGGGASWTGVILSVALNGYIIYYLIRRKDYFLN